MPLSTGQVVNNRYRIARLLGQGGMGAVYRAWDLSLNIPVALKEMIPEPGINTRKLSELRGQFRREAQVLANLNHPNLPRVTDFFEWYGNAYLVMDFVEGESLDQLIARQGPLPEATVKRWAGQLLGALQACHARNILHRDIKPQNIIIRTDGQAVLVDFGLVKLWDPNHPKTQRIIRGMGTLAYASPEHFHIRGQHTEPRSDLYSLGATIYHALTGREPPSAMNRGGGYSLPAPRDLGLHVQPQTENVVLRAMKMDMKHRFANAQEMGRTLQLGPGAGASAPPPDVTSPWIEQTGGEGTYPEVKTSAESRPLTRDTNWVTEMGAAMLMAALGVLAVQVGLFAPLMSAELYIGRSLVALLLGALGWFAGDLIFQALARPEASAQPTRTNRPTERLVAFTRSITRGLSGEQQIILLIFLLAGAAILSWLLAPPLLRIPFIYDYVQFYAVVGPLAYAATGRKQGRAFVAHTLVVILIGALLGKRLNIPQNIGSLIVVAVVGGALMEGVAYLANQILSE